MYLPCKNKKNIPWFPFALNLYPVPSYITHIHLIYPIPPPQLQMGTVFVNAGVVYRKKECWKNDWDRSEKWKNDFWEQNKNFHKLKTKRNWSFKSDERRKWRKNTERSHLYPQHKTFITSYLIFYQACIETISLLHGNPSNCGM